jgi:hypothetical protein
MDKIDFDLEIDESNLRQRGESDILLDETWKMLAKESRIGLSVVESTTGEEKDRKLLYVILRCAAAPHPDCSLSWFKLTLSFDKPQSLRVEDMSPELVNGDQPVKITTTFNGGLALEVSKVKIGPNATIEKKSETQYYFSNIRSSGKSFNYAQWIFDTPPGQDLHINRDLHMLISYPSDTDGVTSQITVRSHLTRKGMLGYIPLIGRRSKKFSIDKEF